MNFKLKALTVAAVATMTLSGAANALTNNEMFLVAYDATNAKTFVAALGNFGTASSFTGASNVSQSFAADTNWINFITGASSGVAYQVLGFNSVGAGSYNAADNLLVSTNAMGANVMTNGQMNTLMASVSVATGSINLFEAGNASVTGTSTGLVIGGGNTSGVAVNTNVFNLALGIPDTTAALGQNLNFWDLTRPAGTANPTRQIQTQFVQGAGGPADVWNLGANGLLTYTGASVAAVPEANTWAMMMLGLGFMGFVARRRA